MIFVGPFYSITFWRGILRLIITPGLWSGGMLGWIRRVIVAATAGKDDQRSEKTDE
jgi:hypothetical protein